MTQLDGVSYPLRMLSLTGMNPLMDKTNNYRYKFIVNVYLPLAIGFNIWIIVSFLFIEWNVRSAVEIFDTFALYIQLPIKLLNLIIHRQDLYEVLKNRKKRFWAWNILGEEAEDKFNRRTKRYLVLAICYFTLANSFGFILALTPILSEEHQLPHFCWVPGDSDLAFNIIWAIESFIMTTIVLFVPAHDFIFALLTVDVSIQFNVLDLYLRKLPEFLSDEKQYEDELKKCIEHHIYLYRNVEAINRIYSYFFFGQFGMNLGGFCMQAFILSSREFGVIETYKGIPYIVAIAIQLLFYCFPGESLTHQASGIVEAAYDSGWHLTPNKNVRYMVGMIITRALPPTIIKAGGLFPVNRAALIMVYRATFFVYTFLTKAKTEE